MGVFQKKELETPDLSSLNAPAPELKPPPELLTPAAMSYMNSMVAAAVKEAISGLHAAQAAVSPLTAEGLVAAFGEAERVRRLPTETEVAFKKRQEREKKNMHEEQETNRKNLALVQENCSHRYPNSQLSIAAVNNMPDRNPRFLCLKCQLLIQPRRWECGQLPTDENPKGTDSIVAGHPLYQAIAKEYATTHQS